MKTTATVAVVVGTVPLVAPSGRQSRVAVAAEAAGGKRRGSGSPLRLTSAKVCERKRNILRSVHRREDGDNAGKPRRQTTSAAATARSCFARRILPAVVRWSKPGRDRRCRRFGPYVAGPTSLYSRFLNTSTCLAYEDIYFTTCLIAVPIL